MKAILARSSMILILLAGCFSIAGHAGDSTADFVHAVEMYKEGRYVEAAGLFESIAATGIQSGQLYYNIGNAYLKHGDLGRAILWYERAKRMIPGDPELDFNLNYARTLTKDETEAAQEGIRRILFFWKYRFSPAALSWMALSANLIFFSILILRLFLDRRRFRLMDGLPLVLAVVLSATVLYDPLAKKTGGQAVILPEKVSVRAGLTEDSTELFILHAGTLVSADRIQQTHVRIRFSNGKIGWVRQDEIGFVVSPDFKKPADRDPSGQGQDA